MSSGNWYRPRQPSRPAKGALILVASLLSGGLLVPVTPEFQARAESVWTTASFDDFNATGASFTNCELNGTGNDTRVVLKQAPDWVKMTVPKSPPARSYCGMAAIDTDDKVVLFGGTDFSSNMGDTWVYDLGDNKWTEMTPAKSPPAREYCQMATVFGDDKVVLFGGMYVDQDGNWVMFNDTWVYDLGDNTWTERTPASSPPPSIGFSMATIFGTDTIVLVPGLLDFYNDVFTTETWTYNISDNTWTLRHPATSPMGRYGQAMASVWNDDSVVLFGGYNGSYFTLQDTWVYDLGDDQWYQKSPATSPPSTYLANLATRYNDDKVLLFGVGGLANGTYIYDLGDDQWMLQEPADAPDSRIGMCTATIANTNYTVVFGGYYANMFQDTWVWDPKVHYHWGQYLSQPESVGGPAYFLSINWTATVPDRTSIKFQVRTADTDYNLSWRIFTGPDGKSTSYYTKESALWFTTPGDSWVQYRALFATTNASTTPELRGVNIGFDLFPGEPVLLWPPDGGWVNTTSPVFSWRFNDTDTDSQGMFDWQLGRLENFTPPAYMSGEVGSNETTYVPYEPLPEGEWLWRVRTADGCGWGPYSEIRTVGVDISPPMPFTPSVEPVKWTSGAINLTFITFDNVSGIANYTIFIDNTPCGAHDSPWTLPELPDGTHNIVVRAYDMAGNWVEGRTKAFVDRTPPADFTPVAMPSSWTRTSPQITFQTRDNASGMDHYEVEIDGGAFQVRTSPYTPPGLDDGEHMITVRALDRAGNQIERNVTIYIDSSEPDPFQIGVDPPGWTNLDQAVSFWTQDATSDIERYDVQIDYGPFRTETSPFKLAGLEDGAHTITVRAYDQGGNYAEAQARVFTDRTPPESFTVTADPAGWTSKLPVISFVTQDNLSTTLTYNVSVDNGTFMKARSPWTLPTLTDGAHLIVVRACDETGNFAEANVTVFIDTSPPDKVALVINNGSRTTQSRNVRLSITAQDPDSGLGQMCFSDDGKSYTQWESFAPERNWTLTSGNGGKLVYIKVRDSTGNEAWPVPARINLAEPAGPDTRTPMAIRAVIIVVALAVAIVGYAVLRRKRRA